MQDRYTGDVGDFGKFGLLRALHRADPLLRLGLIWYLFPDEGHNADGKHIAYLSPSSKNDARFRLCDPELYEKLRAVVHSGQRYVRAIPQFGILPDGTIHFDEPLAFDGSPTERLAARDEWLTRALAATAGCDVVLLDPDNGLECSVPRHRAKAGKYVYVQEIAPMLERDQCVVLYQHLDRSAPACVQIARRAQRLTDELCLSSLPLALRHRSGTSRVYYFLEHQRHPAVTSALRELTSGAWARQFSLADGGALN